MVVVDASVVFKWFDQNEIHFDQAKQLLNAHLSESNSLVVPDLIFYELTNAWSTKRAMDTGKIKINLGLLQEYQLAVVPFTLESLRNVSVFAKTYQVSAYDATYAVLAKEKNCNLITADEKFVKRVALPFIKSLKDSS